MAEMSGGHSVENDCPEWVKRAVTLRDHFDDWTTMRVAEPQPQYGLVQLNVERKGVLISVDVKRADLLAALDACVIPPAATCSHGELEGECASCAACAACRGECGVCPYVFPPAKPATEDAR